MFSVRELILNREPTAGFIKCFLAFENFKREHALLDNESLITLSQRRICFGLFDALISCPDMLTWKLLNCHADTKTKYKVPLTLVTHCYGACNLLLFHLSNFSDSKSERFMSLIQEITYS